MRARTMFLLPVLGLACGRSATDPPPRAPLGTTHVAPRGTMPPDTRPPPRVAVPPELQTFSAVVADLERHPPGREHAELVAALRQLAEAVAVVAPQQIAELDAIRRGATELETSDEHSSWHADRVRFSLEAAVRALADTRARYPDHAVAYADAVAALQRAVEAIEPRSPLTPQYAAVVEALRTAGEAIAVGSGVVDHDRVGAR